MDLNMMVWMVDQAQTIEDDVRDRFQPNLPLRSRTLPCERPRKRLKSTPSTPPPTSSLKRAVKEAESSLQDACGKLAAESAPPGQNTMDAGLGKSCTSMGPVEALLTPSSFASAAALQDSAQAIEAQREARMHLAQQRAGREAELVLESAVSPHERLRSQLESTHQQLLYLQTSLRSQLDRLDSALELETGRRARLQQIQTALQPQSAAAHPALPLSQLRRAMATVIQSRFPDNARSIVRLVDQVVSVDPATPYVHTPLSLEILDPLFQSGILDLHPQDVHQVRLPPHFYASKTSQNS